MNIKKKFGKYFFEFLMLFAAVTAGFWVENYREEHNEKRKLSQKLQAFVSEYEAVSDTAVFNSYYKNYLIPLMEVCASAKLNDSFEWTKESLSFINQQRSMLQSEFLDDLLRQSFITEDENYVHISNDSLTYFFLQLNDDFYKNERLRDIAYKLDDSVVAIFNNYHMMDLLYDGPAEDSLDLHLRNTLGSTLPDEEKLNLLNQDKAFKRLLGLIQITHMDGYGIYKSVIQKTQYNINKIRAEIDKLD